jgi:multidrug efflux system outer membrane protein
MRASTLLRSVVVALVLTGCAMGPSYERPENIPPPVGWRDTSAVLRDSTYANLPWWEVYHDSTLQELIRVSLRENRDIRVAIARVNEARALLGIARIEFLPQIDIVGGVRRAEGLDSLFTDGQNVRELGYLGATLSWEIDLWGRIRRLNESARASLLATEYGRRGAILTVVSEVARAYMELRDFDAQLALAERQVEIRQQSLTLAKDRFEGGLTSELDVRQGESALASAEGIVAALHRQRTQKENELSVLLGRPPGDIPRGKDLVEQDFPAEVPAGIPSDLLLRLPAIRQSEEELHAANAKIGVAVASLFPTISLTARGGTASTELGNLFSAGTGFFSLAGNLLGPIINRGRNLKQVAAERARTEGAVARYEQAVLSAFRDVEDGLVAVQRSREEAEAGIRAVEAARRTVELATLRYEGGVDNFLNLLDAQRVMLDAELNTSAAVRRQKVAVVQLYKALGGGWDLVTDTLALPLNDGDSPGRDINKEEEDKQQEKAKDVEKKQPETLRDEVEAR